MEDLSMQGQLLRAARGSVYARSLFSFRFSRQPRPVGRISSKDKVVEGNGCTEDQGKGFLPRNLILLANTYTKQHSTEFMACIIITVKCAIYQESRIRNEHGQAIHAAYTQRCWGRKQFEPV